MTAQRPRSQSPVAHRLVVLAVAVLPALAVAKDYRRLPDPELQVTLEGRFSVAEIDEAIKRVEEPCEDWVDKQRDRDDKQRLLDACINQQAAELLRGM